MWNLPFKRSAIIAIAVALFSGGSQAETRQIFICTSASSSPTVQKAVQGLLTESENIPVFKALSQAGDADAISARTSEDLLRDKASKEAAHNHLVVIGLRSKDPLLDKVWGFTATIDDTNKRVYAEGWGYLEGDVGWIECDRNPFLHTLKTKNAPEDTVLIKISGSSERGVLAALGAFRKGQLNGLVPAGSIQRPKRTILDMDPYSDPIPVQLPATIEIGSEKGFFAGWLQIGATEYRAILEASSLEPMHIWRAKYLSMHALEQQGIVRWEAGLNRRAFGNSIDVMQFRSAAEARLAVSNIVADKTKNKGDKFAMDAFHPIETANSEKMWEIPQAKEEDLSEAHWNIIVTSAGQYVLMSTLPKNTTVAIGELLAHARAVAQ